MTETADIKRPLRRTLQKRPLAGGVDGQTGEAGKVKKPAIIFIFLLILPVYFYLGPLRLPPYLIFLLLMIIPCMVAWLTGRAGKKNIVDYMVIGTTLWQCIAILLSGSPSQTIEASGLIILQILGGYMLARTMIRNIETFTVVAKTYLFVLFLMFPFAILETLSGHQIYLKILSFIAATPPSADMEPRLGLTRVQAAFEHPILYGIFCASGFSIVYYAFRIGKSTFSWLASIGVVLVSTFISLSTGAYLVVAVQVGLMSWGWIFRKTVSRWKILGGLIAFAYIAVDLISNRTPFHVFVHYLTFYAQGSYTRIHQWEYGMKSVFNYPLFGLGLGSDGWEHPDWMSGSVDNFWLVIGIRYGLPAWIMLGAAFVLLLVKIGNRKELSDQCVKIRTGITFSLIGIIIGVCTVHLWNASLIWSMFLLGSGVWLFDEGRSSKEVKAEEQRRRLAEIQEARDKRRQELKAKKLEADAQRAGGAPVPIS